jgi:hypothetical protein
MWLEMEDGKIPIFSTLEEANKYFIKYKSKELKGIKAKCGCYGNCCREKYMCPKAYNTGNPFNDYIVECCSINHTNTKPKWYNKQKHVL